jgi:hypothetical protein
MGKIRTRRRMVGLLVVSTAWGGGGGDRGGTEGSARRDGGEPRAVVPRGRPRGKRQTHFFLNFLGVEIYAIRIGWCIR